MRGEGRTKFAFGEGYVQTTITLEGLSLCAKLRLVWAVIRGQALVIEECDNRAQLSDEA